MTNVPSLRIGVFIDGTYFSLVSRYYRNKNPLKSYIDHAGIIEFLRIKVADKFGAKPKNASINQSHLYIGLPNTYSAYRVNDQKSSLAEVGVEMHPLPLRDLPDGKKKEEGVDVLLGIHAYKHARDGLDIVVLITGDGDFIPLVDELHSIKKKVVLVYWNMSKSETGETQGRTTNTDLIMRVDLAINMNYEIENGVKAKNVNVYKIFNIRPPTPLPPLPKPKPQPIKTATNEEVFMGTIADMDLEKGYIRPFLNGGNLVSFRKSTVLLENVKLHDLTKGRMVEFKIKAAGSTQTVTEIRLIK